MRIVVLADGASVHTEKWIKGLRLSMNCEIDLITLNPKAVRGEILEEIGSAHVHDLAPKQLSEAGGNSSYLLKIPQIRKLIKQIQPDILTCIYLTSYGFLGAVCKGKSRLCHFAIGSDILVTPKKSFLHFHMAKWALSRADLVMSVSQTVAHDILQKFKFPQSKLIVQHYGLEPSLLTMSRDSLQYTFVSNRAWVDNSNVELIAQTLSDFSAEQAAVIGSPAKGYEELGYRIRAAIRSQSQIKEFPNLPYQENIKTVAKSKFLLSWTCTDGTPTSVIEAMAVGTIPIVSDTAPNREWIEDGVNGILVPLDNPDKISSKIKAALALSQDKIQDMVVKNKEIVAKRASLKVNMGRLAERIQQIC